MFTIIAYSQSQDGAGVWVSVDAAIDQHMKAVGDGIFIGDFNHLFGAMACIGSGGEEARLVSPSLRRVNPFYISPIELALYPDGNPHHCVTPSIDIPLDVNEALEAWINATPGAGAEQASVIVWLAPGAVTPVSGRIFTVNFEATFDSTAGLWNFAEIDFVDELPVGTYDVVGGALLCDTGVAFRFVPVGASHRPGAPCQTDEELNSLAPFRYGKLGTWFSFTTTQPPGIELISSAAVAAKKQGFMDVLVR